MRAAVLTGAGGPVLQSFREPVATAPEEVVVDVLAAGLNPIDLAAAAGLAGPPQSVPRVAGREAVARADGRRVYFSDPIAPFGGLAERSLARRAELVALPDALDDELAVAIGVAGVAAWLALTWRGALTAGETVLVLGATGVVGALAVQAARLLGAGRVIAAGRDPDGLRRAGERGADAVVALGDAHGAEGLRDACGAGADLIIDTLWGQAAVDALGAARPGARLVQVGNAAARSVQLPAAAVRGAGIGVLGYSGRWVPHELRLDAYAQLANHAAAGRIAVECETRPLAQIESAWADQGNAPHRKLILRP